MSQTLIDLERMYSDEVKRNTQEMFDNLYHRFNKNILMMLDSKKPRTQYTDKGRLEPRRAYRYKFSNQLFKQNQNIPTGDTTLLFLIDGSQSMGNNNRIGKCSAIASAFGKSINDVTKNELKFEVFVKHAPAVWDENYGGSFVSLTKVASNVGKSYSDFSKLLRLNTNSPFSRDGESVGSYTSEFSVLPALREYMAKNLTTKNAIVVNLTDGEAYCTLGSGTGFNNYENGLMRTKYLSQIPHTTVIVDGGMSEKFIAEAYGQNVIQCKDHNFVPQLFKTFMSMLEAQYE